MNKAVKMDEEAACKVTVRAGGPGKGYNQFVEQRLGGKGAWLSSLLTSNALQVEQELVREMML